MDMESIETRCRGPGCEETRLIRAHIIPRAFARMNQNRNKEHNLEISLGQVKPTQLGIYDKQILCATCDGHLGRHDDYLYDVIGGFVLPPRCKEFSDPKVDCDAFSKGILAILWRASLTSQRAYADFPLGPYEHIVRDILFGLRPLADMRELEIAIQYYRSGHFGKNVKCSTRSRCETSSAVSMVLERNPVRFERNRSFRRSWRIGLA